MKDDADGPYIFAHPILVPILVGLIFVPILVPILLATIMRIAKRPLFDKA
jgi:hypothetical protein